jgi:hypothetical protein
MGGKQKEVNMSLSWKDGLATAFVGAAVVLYMLSHDGTTIAGLSGPRALTVAIFGLGIGGCDTAKSHMQAVYGVGGGPRPPLLYVVLVSALGGVTLVAGIVAIAGGGDAALATLTAAMVALWALATIRHSMSRMTHEPEESSHLHKVIRS